ncbi:MAG: patatin-like phospholipase family protein [Campylobacterota bacterium]|nr:patatin-like phospholipase family protein [Campylobacterota bacterium]
MKKDIALFLGSGGARGYVHIGVIRELESQGYVIRSISGSSMGALVGGLYACGKLDEFEEWVTKLNPLDVLKLVDFTFGKSGFVKGDKVFDKIKDMVGKQKIEDLKIPFTAVATDLKKREEYLFAEGSLVEAIRASVAIPTMLTAVVHGERTLVDGGLCNPSGIVTPKDDSLFTVSVDLNADIAVDSSYLKAKDKNPLQSKIEEFLASKVIDNNSLGLLEIIQESIETMQKIIAGAHLEETRPDLTIAISSELCSFYDFHRAQELIEYGRKTAHDVLGNINE